MGRARTSILEILRNANSSVSVLRSSRAAHHRKTSQIGTPRHWQLCWRRDSREPGQIFKREADGCAPSAQHVAGNLDNLSGLFARRQRTSMSAYFTNSLTPPTGLGLLSSPRDGFLPVG